ncbi:BTB/POZ domain-containing protein 6-B-like [Cimex lectularius]|uniref:BTB domain-containing protein n=1 Tax=Cimex lectularius TaxID=79782 RepID=A0A8I6RN47_CIMLE|nr:BTB/POZ domain-containing protein 6-B-like [Cimex lectularius]
MEGEDADWQIQLDKVVDRGYYILKNSFWTDCVFVVGNDENKKEFKAHKLFLSMSSPVFEKMFTNRFIEEKADVHVVDIQPEAFGAMLKYIYTDKVEIESFDQACELCYVAKKYMIHNLLKQCTAYVLKDVNVTNVCRGYEFAKLFDQVELMEKCENVICEKTSSVLSTPSFLEAQISTVMMILDEKKLSVTEVELFKAVELWTKAEFTRRGILGDEFADEQQKIYDQIVPKICFLNMNARDFADGPALSPLLKPDQSFAILLNLTASNSSCPLPNGFSTMLRDRMVSSFGESYCLDWPCYRLEKHTVFQNTDSYVSFSCDKDITLKGVMVLTKIATFNRDEYENVEIYLHDWTTNTTHRATFNGVCENEKILRVYFPNNIQTCRGRAYKVGLILKNSGQYTGRFLNTSEFVFKSCTFKLIENRLPIYMQGIIFSD